MEHDDRGGVWRSMLSFLLSLFGPNRTEEHTLRLEERRARSSPAVVLPLVAAGVLAVTLTALLPLAFAALSGAGASLAAVLFSRALGRVMRRVGFAPVVCDRTATQCSHLLSFLLVMSGLVLARLTGIAHPVAS